jgi:TPR repeat protein
MLVGLTLVSLAACSHRTADAPSGSDAGVVLVPNMLRTCSDLPTCEDWCRRGSASECLAAANNYSTGVGTAKDETRATHLFEEACSLQDGAGCNLAGRAHEFGHGVPINLPSAVSLYGRACDLDYQGGCYNLAIVLERGSGTTRDVEEALRLYRNLCTVGSPTACAAAERLEPTRYVTQ